MRTPIFLSLVGTLLAGCLFASPAVAQALTGPGFITATKDKVLLDIPPRKMWGWGIGHGYCGEMSFQSSLLYYGSYVSQERVRYADGNKELLIGVHDEKAAKKLKLTYEAFDFDNEENPHAPSFLDFTMRHLRQGSPVIAGWFLKQRNGDEDYDHIMPIVGFEGKNDGNKRTPPSKATITYNDLYLLEHREVSGPSAFQSRGSCTTKKATQPYGYCLPIDVSYGIAITGNVDPEKVLYRTMLRTDSTWEPDWGAEDKLNEPPVDLTFTATVYGLTANEEYAILRFDSSADLEDSRDFLSLDYAWRHDFTAAGPTYVLPGLVLRSDGEHFYRTVSVRGLRPNGNDTPSGPSERAGGRGGWSFWGLPPVVSIVVVAAAALAVTGIIAAALTVARSRKALCFRSDGCCGALRSHKALDDEQEQAQGTESTGSVGLGSVGVVRASRGAAAAAPTADAVAAADSTAPAADYGSAGTTLPASERYEQLT